MLLRKPVTTLQRLKPLEDDIVCPIYKDSIYVLKNGISFLTFFASDK
jgi:hypothetical protein